MNFLYKIFSGQSTLQDQDEALKDPETAYYFALWIPGADIERCQEVVCRDSGWAYCFARHIPGANIQKSIDACKGTEFESVLNEYLMEKALL